MNTECRSSGLNLGRLHPRLWYIRAGLKARALRRYTVQSTMSYARGRATCCQDGHGGLVINQFLVAIISGLELEEYAGWVNSGPKHLVTT
jgi:hypothetical protein